MAFFELNGIPIAPPARGLEFVLSTAVTSGRSAQNKVVGERIGRDTLKYNNLTWPWLDASEWHKICSILDSTKFGDVTAKMWHPGKGRFVYIKIYPGDRSAQPYWLDENGNPIAYTSCKVNVIDTNQTDIDEG